MKAHCDFCGYDFDPTCAEVQSCSGCPLQRGCQRLSCPRCGYPVLGEADLLRWARLLKERFIKQPSGKTLGADERG